MIHIHAENLDLIYPIKQRFSLSLGKRRHANRRGGRIETRGNQRFVTALRNVNFSLGPGDRLGLVGPNGAGKTTLLKVLYGILEPTSGRIDIGGRIDALFNLSLGFRPWATGRRNIELRGLINGWSAEAIDRHMDEIIAFSELEDFIDMPFKTYSQGMAARLAFSVATVLEPEILLMDEWIGAGDKAFQQKARERMSEIADRAGIIVLASHNESLIRRTCNKTLRLENGVAEPIQDIAQSDVVED